jgi:pimeloyl-ACP methyl ester carboxylesterase
MSTWILLRGLTREARHWGEFPRALGAAFPGDRVLALELPGNGELNQQRSPARVPELAAACREQLDRLGIAPPYHLVAMSLGAMVATAWAQAQPREIAACVLINTSFGGFSPLQQRLRPRSWAVLAGILLSWTPEARERRILGLTSGRPQAHPEAVAAWAAIRRSRPVSLGNGLRQLLAAARYRAPARAPVPTLVLLGAGDRLVDNRCSRTIAARWQCPLASHPGAGHDLPLDAGDWVVAEIGAWLAAGG